MKLSKLFLRWISVFGLIMTFAVSGWGAAASAPTIAAQSFSVNVNTSGGYIIGTVVTGGGVPDTFSITNGNSAGNFAISNTGVLTVASGKTLSTAGTYNLSVTVQNNKGSATATITVNVASYVCPNPRTFTAAATTDIYGNVMIIGNTNLCKNNGNGVCSDPGASRNNDINMMYSDPDGSSDPTTFNSSSANFSLPANSTIKWAKLYWQGYLVGESDAVKNSSKSVKFKKTGQSYTTIDSSAQNYNYNWIYFTSDRYYYQGSADVTAQVVAGGTGSYTVANIVSETGQPTGGSYGGWALVIIYENANETFKNITVFDGYKGIVTSGDQGTASNYVTTNGCSTDTGVANSMTIPLSGFLTPKSGTVNSSLSIFAGEGDKGATGDHMSLTDKSGISHYIANALNPYDDIFNSTITYNGTTVTNITSPVSITPYYSANSLGLDIDTFDVSKDKDGNTLIGNNQTSTNVTLNTDGDGYMPGVFAFATQLYVPKFCYDYGYQQNGLPFTEQNNGTAMPYITGVLPNTSDINVSLYIRNQENSDVSANNVIFNISDINSSQAIYKRNSVEVTYPDQFIPTAKTDSAWPLSVSDTYIHNIPLGNMEGSKYAYIYYTLTPTQVGNIRMPINGTFSYTLSIPLPDGTTFTLPYTSTIGGAGLPMCSSDNFSYTPEWGIFSVVDAGLYDNTTNANNTTGKKYYDLTTQVTKRPGNFRVASFNATLLDTPKPVSTMVAVELIDASQFHDVDAACREPSSAVTPRIWTTFENNVSQVNFNAATIQNAINNGLVSNAITGQPITLASAADFFKTATPNAAFRVSFNSIVDQNDSLIHLQSVTHGVRIDNFSNIQQLYPHCRQFVKNPNNGTMTNLTSVACSDNGNNSTYKDVATCMECLFGARTQVLCSRDNFAIRPESYTVSLKDVNQTNRTVTQLFAPGHTGVAAPITSRVDVSSGYDYRYDINATNHLDNTASPGYTRYFATGGQDYNITLVWEPTTTKTGCNDTQSKAQSFNLIDGIVSADGNLSQVGEYRLNIIDKTWTAVDWDPTKQTHQTGSHFLSGTECALNSNDVPSQASVVTLTGTTLSNLVGCDISSTHDNIENGLKYRDYLLTFHPYKFDMSTIGFGTGILPTVIGSGGKGFTYMSRMSRDDSMNMSLRASGNIKGVGYNNLTNSNFVKNCYAKDLNLSMKSDNNLTHPQKAKYQVRFMDYNTSDTNVTNLIYDSKVIDINTSKLIMKVTAISEGNFTKSTAGSLYTVSRFNYDRNETIPLTPVTAQLSELDVKCISTTECTMQAGLSATHQAVGAKAMDFNLTYAYGRINPMDVRVFGNVPFTANAWYEVYQLPILAGTILAPSRNTPLWFINGLHDDNNDGNSDVTIISPNTLSLPVNSDMVTPPNDGMETYSFAKIGSGNIPYSGKAHINTDPWLWYGINALDYIDPSVTNVNCQRHPCFNINIVPDIGRAGSATSTDLRSNKTNKGTSKTGVHYDYTPATR